MAYVHNLCPLADLLCFVEASFLFRHAGLRQCLDCLGIDARISGLSLLQSRRPNPNLWGLCYTLLLVTALLRPDAGYPLLFVVATAAVLYFLNRNGWSTLLILSIFMVYIGHILWLIGNPLSGHPVAQF